MAAGASKVAVFSMARYSALFTYSRDYWFDWRPAKAHPALKSLLSVPGEEHRNLAARCLLQHRSFKLYIHELGHLLGIDHCIHYHCCMNGSCSALCSRRTCCSHFRTKHLVFLSGSGHLLQDHTQPLHLCPLELRKLQYRFTVSLPQMVARYHRLLTVYRRMAEEESKCAVWMARMKSETEKGAREDVRWMENRLRQMHSHMLSLGAEDAISTETFRITSIADSPPPSPSSPVRGPKRQKVAPLQRQEDCNEDNDGDDSDEDDEDESPTLTLMERIEMRVRGEQRRSKR